MRTACIAGDVGIRASVNTSNQIQYDVVTINDRTSGTRNAVIYNRDNSDASYNIQVGDKITLEEFIYSTSTTSEIGPVDKLVTGRRVIMERGRQDEIILEIGGENRTFTDMMQRRTNLQSVYA